MSTTAVPAVIDYLVSSCRTSATIGLAVPPVSVIDGALTAAMDDQLMLWIGMDDPDNVGGTKAAESTQDWAALGARKRDEHLIIHCVIDVWTGEDEVQQARLKAAAIMAAVEDQLRGDVNLGGTVLFQNPGVTGATWLQQNTNRGMQVRVLFQVACFARIGG